MKMPVYHSMRVIVAASIVAATFSLSVSAHVLGLTNTEKEQICQAIATEMREGNHEGRDINYLAPCRANLVVYEEDLRAVFPLEQLPGSPKIVCGLQNDNGVYRIWDCDRE